MASVAAYPIRKKKKGVRRRAVYGTYYLHAMAKPFSVFFSRHKYVEYQAGDCNVILSVPHGGRLRPVHIPNRDAGYFDKDSGKVKYDHESQNKDPIRYPVRYKKDSNTIELATHIADEFKSLTGKRPHVIICHLHRTKLDANTDREKATFGHTDAENAWKAFHGYIERAKQSIKGTGIIFDIHGQAHPENWVELGYTLSIEALNSQKYLAEHTSIAHLAARHPHITIEELIYGLDSFGGLLLAEGYKVVPSPTYPKPGSGNYYTGGYNTQTHGSEKGGVIDGIQIETPRSMRDSPMISEYGKAVARTIKSYRELYYAPQVEEEKCDSVDQDEIAISSNVTDLTL